MPAAAKTSTSDDEWLRFGAIIKSLYFDDNEPLPSVMRIMRDKYGFKASTKVYRAKLKSMGVSKNLKPSEALAMARVMAYRDARGMSSEFWRGGTLFDSQKLGRYLRLNPSVRDRLATLSVDDQLRTEAIEALLPPHIIVLSPSAPLSLSTDLEGPEKMMIAFRDFTDQDRFRNPWFSASNGRSETQLLYWKLEHNMHEGIEMMRTDPVAGGQRLQTAFSCVEPIVSRAEPWTLVPLLWRLSRVHQPFGKYTPVSWGNRAPEVARILIDYIGQVSAVTHGNDHPLTVIFQGFARYMFAVENRTQLYAIQSFWGLICSIVNNKAGRSTFLYTMAYTWHQVAGVALVARDPMQRLQGVEAFVRSHLADMITWGNDGAGAKPNQAFVFALELANVLDAQDRFEEAVDSIRAALKRPNLGPTGVMRWLGYQKLALLYEDAGRKAEARKTRDECARDRLSWRAGESDDTGGLGDLEGFQTSLERGGPAPIYYSLYAENSA